MKRRMIKAIAAGLCAGLLGGAVALPVYALPGQPQTQAKTGTAAEAKTEAANEVGAQTAAVKDETVYVIAEADGSVSKIIVSDWLQNALSSAALEDVSELSDVMNIKGEEGVSQSGNSLSWDAQGNDIYYQGTIEKELPVEWKITYTLDGTEISAQELAGKSGHVTMRFDYTNRQSEEVEINGKTEKIYVPFVVVTGMVLDNEVFRNVEITNGKLLNDGDRIAAVGIALPGMQENLGIGTADLEIPSYVEISADVENFSLSTMMTLVTNEVFNTIDPDDTDSLDELFDAMDELTDAMEQLLDGSNQLADGLNTLLEKSGELIDGIGRLAEGAQALKDGVGSLVSGAAQLQNGAGQLQSGAAELTNGLNTLAANNDTLNGGAAQVFESLLSVADSQLAAAGLSVPKLTIANYAEVLNGVIASLDEGNVSAQAQAAALEKVTQAVRAQESTVRAAVTDAVKQQVKPQVEAAVRANVEQQVLAAMGMTKEEYEAGIAAGVITEDQQAQIQAAVDAQMASETVQALIEQNTEGQLQSDEIAALISSKTEEQIQALITQNMNSAEVQNQITAALEQAKSGAASISALKAQLDSYNQFYSGLRTYTAGVASAAQGAGALNSGIGEVKNGIDSLCAGANQLYAGAGELSDGIGTLQNGSSALTEGVTELRDGAVKLADGLEEFNEKGIQKLVNMVNGDVSDVLERMRATVKVSKNYKSFSGISDEMEGQVKFIYRTEAIEAPQE